MDGLKSALEAVLFAAGDSIPIARLSLVFGVAEEEITAGIEELRNEYERDGRGLRVLRAVDLEAVLVLRDESAIGFDDIGVPAAGQTFRKKNFL